MYATYAVGYTTQLWEYQRLEYQQVHHLRNFPIISSVLFAQ